MKSAHMVGLARIGFAIALVVGVGWVPSAQSAEPSTETRQERHHERANELREQAKRRAQSQLGYETIPSDLNFQRNIDFYSLGEQIKRLGDLIQHMASPAASQPQRALSSLVPVMPTGPDQADVHAVYGPEGPTEKSVRLILDYRLTVAGNPRLKLGSVKAGKDSISATVVTNDGSLVEEYEVDKKTGVWTPVRR